MKNKEKNNKGFTLIELLAVIAVLALISTIAIYGSVNVIGNAQEKSYLVSVNNIEKVAASYTIENTKEIVWNDIENSKNQYYCVSIKDLIETGYFDSSILKTKVSDDEVVNESNYIYVERDYSTKTIVKNSLVTDSSKEYTDCMLYKNSASISFVVNPNGWTKEKEITIIYKLIKFDGDYKDYSYSSKYDDEEVDKDNFDSSVITKKVSVLDNGVLYSEIKDKDGKIVANKILNVGKIDNNSPKLELIVNNGDKFKQSNDFIVRLVDGESGLKKGNYFVYYKWSLNELSCDDLINDTNYVELSVSEDGINVSNEITTSISNENGLGSVYTCVEDVYDVAGNKYSGVLFEKVYLDNEKPIIKLGNYNGSNDVSKSAVIPLVLSDEYSGINESTISIDKFIVKIGNTVVKDGISLEKINTNNYNLIINNVSANGLVTVDINKDKVFDNANNGNEKVSLNTNVSFKNTYTINYYFKDTLVGTSECSHGNSCTLREFDLTNNFLTYDSNNKWNFYGWTISKMSMDKVYENKATFTYDNDGDINLYAIGYKDFYFYSGVSPSDSNGYVKKVQYLYPSNDDYLSSIIIPELKNSIDGWSFIGYLCGSNNANGIVTYVSSQQNTSVIPEESAKQSCRGVYERPITIKYNANGGSGTISDTVAKQYYNTGNADNGKNNGANVSNVVFTLASNNFIKTGYKFNKWALNSTSGAKYSAGDTYEVMPEVDINSTIYNMYALWNANRIYFNFNVNGGTIVSSTTSAGGTVYTWTTNNGIVYRSANGGNSTKNFWYKNYGATDIDLPNWDNSKYIKINKSGYVAKAGAEWICYEGCIINNKTFSDSIKYMSSDFCDTSNGDCTVKLNVNWVKNTYTIKYDANGGTGAPGNQIKTHDTTLTLSSVKPTNGNYEFLGWSTDKNATSATYNAGGKYTSNSNATLYAVWFGYPKYKTTGEVNVWRADSNCTGTSTNSEYYSYWCGSCYLFQSRPNGTEFYLVGRDTTYGGNTTIYLYVYVSLSDTALIPLSKNCTSQVALGEYSGEISVDVDGSSKTLPVVINRNGNDLYLVRMITYCENSSCGGTSGYHKCYDGSCNTGWVTNWRP